MAKTTNNTHSPAVIMTGPALRVQRANRFVFDTAKRWHATIVRIEPQPAFDASRPPRYRWTLEGAGTIRLWQLHFSTPMELGEAIDEEMGEEPIQAQEVSAEEIAALSTNTLAKVCLALQLVSEQDLHPENLEDTLDRLDLSAAIGLSVVCRIAQKNTAFIDGAMQRCNPYYTPILETLALDK